MKNIVYISYDGMYESLGQSQVLSYLNKIVSEEISIDLISFEKEKDLSKKPKIFISNEIFWHRLKYHKRPKLFAVILDIILGLYEIYRIKKKKKLDVIHARSYISAIIALPICFFFSVPFIFDIRGLWIDEKIESGTWKGALFKPIIFFSRLIEDLLFKNASSIVVLTESSKHFLNNKYPHLNKLITVIPTCVNYEIFFSDNSIRKLIRTDLGVLDDEILFIYSGSIGGYYRFDYILDFYEETMQFGRTKLLLLTKSDKNLLLPEIVKRNLVSNVFILSVNYTDVSKYLNSADAGLIIYEKSISSIARSSTKLGEYWACNLPVFAPSDVGDLNFLFYLNNQQHLLLNSFTKHNYKSTLKLFFNGSYKYEFRNEVKSYFDLTSGVNKYIDLYNKY